MSHKSRCAASARILVLALAALAAVGAEAADPPRSSFYTEQVIPVVQRRFSYTFKTPDTALFELLP